VLSNGKYVVTINGADETIPSREGLTIVINDVVLVMVYNGNSSFKFVDCKKPSW
jgi:hypothetical protein